jgi:hypothetical protein
VPQFKHETADITKVIDQTAGRKPTTLKTIQAYFGLTNVSSTDDILNPSLLFTNTNQSTNINAANITPQEIASADIVIVLGKDYLVQQRELLRSAGY